MNLLRGASMLKKLPKRLQQELVLYNSSEILKVKMYLFQFVMY